MKKYYETGPDCATIDFLNFFKDKIESDIKKFEVEEDTNETEEK